MLIFPLFFFNTWTLVADIVRAHCKGVQPMAISSSVDESGQLNSHFVLQFTIEKGMCLDCKRGRYDIRITQADPCSISSQ